MALIDEYKQAIQDVLDGRMKEAPRPSELPWTEDKAATMWAAAAAELIAEANGGDALPDTPGTDGTYALQNTVSSGTGTLSWSSGGSSGGGVFLVTINYDESENADVLDKTWQEIHDAFVIDGKQVVFTFATDPLYPDFHSYYTLISVTHEDGNPYTVAQNHNGVAETYEAYAASDYPALHYND